MPVPSPERRGQVGGEEGGGGLFGVEGQREGGRGAGEGDG